MLFPKKTQLSAPKAVNVFGDDSDLDEDDGVDWVKKSLIAEGEKNKVKKQARLNAQKALKEDPTIFQYDEVYSDLHPEPKKQEEKKKEGPKYIKKLLEAAEKRKKEHEYRIERMVQKEREAEGEMYKDKEQFLTSAYKAKLEEFKKLEAEEKEMERLEAIGDVTKQKDVSGIYRHLFQQKLKEEKSEDDKKELESKREIINKKSFLNEPHSSTSNLDKDNSSVNDSSSDSEKDTNVIEAAKIISKSKKGKQYRKRVVETSESESEDGKEKEKKQESNLKANTILIEKNKTEARLENEKETAKEDKKSEKRSTPEIKVKDLEENKEDLSIDSKKQKEETEEQLKPRKAEKKVDIWKKRTVGPVFEAALQRYYARKAMRETGS